MTEFSLGGRATPGTGFFDTQAERWIGLYAGKPSFRDRLDLFVATLERLQPPPARVLDFGCGPGVIALALRERGYDVTGIDGAPRMIELARAEAARRRLDRVAFEVGTADSLGVEPAAFDAAICSSVIEYVENDAKLVADLGRAIRPGGHLVISVPHADSVQGQLEAAASILPFYRRAERRRHLTYSLRRYRRSAFAELLARAGFGSPAFTCFETAIPGRLGVALSRWRRVGVMLLVAAQRIS